jgi:hypothetical protein
VAKVSGPNVVGPGMNIDPEGRWTPDRLPAGCRWVRYALLLGHDPLPRAQSFVDSGRVPVLVLARETFPPYGGTLTAAAVADTLDSLNARLGPIADKVVIVDGNEWDAPKGSASSWTLEAAELDVFLDECATRMPRFTHWGPGCSSGIPDMWRSVTRRGLVKAVCVHPYGRRYGQVPTQYVLPFENLRDGYRAVLEPGQSLVFTEVGAPRHDLGDSEQAQADYVEAAATTIRPDPWAWFCVDDVMVDGYGVSGRLGWAAFERACEEVHVAKNDDLLQQVWHAGGTSVPYNAAAAICQKWIAMTAAGDPLGIPVTNEVTVQDMPLIVGQGFSSGRRLYWRGGDDVTEKAP